jgi:hypothetical protein
MESKEEKKEKKGKREEGGILLESNMSIKTKGEGMSQKFKERICVLSTSTFSYRSTTSNNTKFNRPLHLLQDAFHSPKDKFPFIFILVFNSKNIFIKASSKLQMDTWIFQILRLQKDLKNKKSNKTLAKPFCACLPAKNSNKFISAGRFLNAKGISLYNEEEKQFMREEKQEVTHLLLATAQFYYERQKAKLLNFGFFKILERSSAPTLQQQNQDLSPKQLFQIDYSLDELCNLYNRFIKRRAFCKIAFFS